MAWTTSPLDGDAAPAEHFSTLAASAARVFVATGRTVSAVEGGA